MYGDTPIITTLLGSAAGASSSTTKGHSTAATTETTKSMSMAPSSSGNVAETNTNLPLPPLPLPPQPATLPAMFPPPPHMTGFLMPSVPPPIMHNNGVPLVLPPPQAPMMLNPMLAPPVLPIMGIPPHHHHHLPNRGGAVAGGGGGAGPVVVPYDSDDFPALGSTTTSSDGRKNQEKISKVALSSDTLIDNNIVDATTTTILPSEAQIIFNNTNPHTPPISAHLVQTKLMPFRDTCFIVNVMMRTLKSLDAYNDDYYHWSVLNNNRTSSGKSTTNHHPLVVSAMPGLLLPPPTPLLKGMKETVKVQEETYHKSVKARAKTFAEEQKSLGQLVRTNVKRPKALLDTPVLKREEDGTANATTTATTTMNVPDTTKYETGQQVSRIHLWKARVAIDRGYTAFLSLMELRRLIQTQMRDPRVIQELMVDVKSNIDLLHSSLGVSVKVVNSETGGKTIEIDKKRLKSTLSLPKGKILCARAIEEGILPHPSACNLLPMALHAIFSEQMPSSDDDGEDRLLSAFTGLILTEHPGVDPMILCRCLEVATSFAAAATGGGGEENTNIDGLASGSGSSLTSSHMRVNLLHSVLTMGKHVCAASPTLEKDWLEKEQEFRGMLNLS